MKDIETLLEELRQRQVPELTEEEYLQNQCRRFNAEEGNMTLYDCPVCRNKGAVAFVKEGRYTVRPCKCMEKRGILRGLKESGITRLTTFDEYITETDWQAMLKKSAMEFCETEGEWFFIGGQSGCGKTHLCTAILSTFLDRGMSGRYLLWRDDGARIKAHLNTPEYEQMIGEYKKADVLYIDDLFKNRAGELPSAGDLHLAFELINTRYASGKTTIISSERMLSQIIEIDEALGSRIFEKASRFCLNINKGRDKNWRLRG